MAIGWRQVGLVSLAFVLLLAATGAEAATKTVTLWPDQFVPVDAASESRMSIYGGVLASAPSTAFIYCIAPLTLPTGAVIQKVGAMLRGTEPTSITTVALLRTGFTTEAQPVTVALVNWEGITAGFQQKTATPDAAVATVRAGYRYFLQAAVRDQYSQLKAVKVTYTVP